MNIKEPEEELPGKLEKCIFDSKKCKDPGLQQISTHFAHSTPLRYVGKILEKNFGSPPDQILDPLLAPLNVSPHPKIII